MGSIRPDEQSRSLMSSPPGKRSAALRLPMLAETDVVFCILFLSASWLDDLERLDARGRAIPEHPSANMVADSFETVITYALPVCARHVVTGMTHQRIEGDLVFGFTTNGLESMTKCVKISTAFDGEGVE